MQDVDNMPPKCHDCSYWEICEYPYVCPTQDEKKKDAVALQSRLDTLTLDQND